MVRTSLAFSEHLTVEALMVGPIYLVSGNTLLAQNGGLVFFNELLFTCWGSILAYARL